MSDAVSPDPTTTLDAVSPDPTTTLDDPPADRRTVVASWVGDLLALAPLVVLFLVLPDRDGGSDLLRIWPLAAACLPAAAVTVAELRHLPRAASWLLLAWVVGLALAVGVAVHRSDALDPLVGYLVAPILLLGAHRLARRRWGLAVLLLLVLVSFGRYQYESWLAWWGWTGLGRQARWAPLSWWNPSATLMAMFSAFFFGLALTSQRVLRIAFVALAATGLAGAWLSGSRAGFAAGVGGLVIAGVIGIRSAAGRGDGWKVMTLTGAALVVLALVMTLGLTSMATTGLAESQPTLARDQPVSSNSVFRVRTWGIAFEMWAARPLTGHGPGSFGSMSHLWAPDDLILAGSVHNEYLEVLAETGPLPAAALTGVALITAWLVVGLIRRPPRSTDDPSHLKAGILAGAGGAAATFFVHSGLDFDWEYPAVSGMAAVLTGILIAHRNRTTERTAAVAVPEARNLLTSPFLAALAGGLLGAALLVALGGTAWELRGVDTDDPLVAARAQAPWEILPQLSLGVQAINNADYDLAVTILRRPQPWNPADARVDVFEAMARFYDGELSADGFAAYADRWPHGTEIRGRIAVALAFGGAEDQARQVADDLREYVADFSSARSAPARTEIVAMEVVLAQADEGCDAAVATANAGLADERLGAPSVARLQRILRELDCPIPGRDEQVDG